MADSDWTHRGDLSLMKRSYQGGNWNAPYDVLEYCLAEKKKTIPKWALAAVLDDYQHGRVQLPTGKGRHAHIEERGKQLVSDGMCYYWIQFFLRQGLKPNAALEEAARRMNLSPSAVYKGSKRHEAMARRADRQGGWIQI